MKKSKKTIGAFAIAFVIISGFVGVSMLNPIAQDISYHSFKDQRTIFGIPNFWNVVSNVPFLIVGAAGLLSIFYSPRIRIISDLKISYITFFLGILFVAFGSGYYHLWPNNETLVWDRLPMTIAFMALFSIIIGEFLSIRVAKYLLFPFIALGAFSVIYWHVTEFSGVGDLRLYGLVQFLPMLVIPIILYSYKSKFTRISGYWLLLGAYLLAKILEHFDGAVYDAALLLSGHSWKHIAAALGVVILMKSYTNREVSI